MVCNSHDGRRDEGEPRSVVSNADYEGIAWGISRSIRWEKFEGICYREFL